MFGKRTPDSVSSVPNVASGDGKNPTAYAASGEYAEEERRARKGHAQNPTPPRTALGCLFQRSDKRNRRSSTIPRKPTTHQHHARYENLHRFNLSFTWTWAEEMSLVREMDLRVVAWAWIAFLSLNLDQSSLIQANSDNFLDDLNMDTNDYNLGTTVFRIAFLPAELPSQLVSKKIRPDRWIPILMITWSIVALSHFWLSGRSSFLAARAIMGLLQGGFIPLIILYLSYFFKGTELPFRLALLRTADRVKDVVVPILAFGILRLRGVHSYAGWRWSLAIEGLIKLVIGIWSVFMMTPSPTQTKAWWRPKGWFTESEEKVLIGQRAYLGLFTQIWFLPCLISLAVLPVDINKSASYALIAVLLSYPTPHPTQAAWCSRNSNRVHTRAVSAALYNMDTQLLAIISANIYREDDKPEYRRGNRVLIALNCFNIAL
ncbi:MAG: hypothetical protein M1833_006782 [Piccolia ochrophora]|nr:MAG: hypothetical protein M1833_006782 [Piccolia ochrophora]